MARVFVESTHEITARLLFAIGEDVDRVLKKARPKIEILARDKIYRAINNSPTVASLLNKDVAVISLQGQFGLTDELAISAVDEIISSAVNSIRVEAVLSKKYRNQDLIGALRISLLPENFLSSLSITNGVYISERSGQDIPWFEWLMTRGVQVVVTGWRVYDSGSETSRSNTGAIMVPGGIFYVPNEHAGTVEDNFITRAVDEIKDDLVLDIRNIIKLGI